MITVLSRINKVKLDTVGTKPWSLPEPYCSSLETDLVTGYSLI